MAWIMKLPISLLLVFGVSIWVVSVNLLSSEFEQDQIQQLESSHNVKHVGPPKVSPLPSWADELPDFNAFAAGDERKQAFFNFLVPIVHHINSQILLDRYQLMGLVETLKQKKILSSKQQRQLAKLIKKYRVEEEDLNKQISRLLLRVDVVPPSLALAQSANESACGQWCYREGCGLVPAQRDEEAVHEVRAFESPVDSVTSYIRNLNTNVAYVFLRQLRRSLRMSEDGISGLNIVQGLEPYSSRGQDYVDELSAMIRYNDLQQYDEY